VRGENKHMYGNGALRKTIHILASESDTSIDMSY